jgi:hypothetical protein
VSLTGGPARYPDPGRPVLPGPAPWGPPREPGPIPLRPLGVGDVLGVAVGITRRHWMRIGTVAAAVALVSGAATLGTLAATDSLATYAAATWLQDIVAGRSTLPPSSVLLALVLNLLISATGGVLTAGVAAAYAGADALGRTDRAAVVDRLRGRWAGLLIVGAVVGVVSTLGILAFVVPGVWAFVVLSMAGPVAVMERAPLAAALRRSTALTEGSRGRIFGALAVANLLAGIGSAIVVTALSPLVLSMLGSTDPVAALVIGEILTALIAFLAGTYCAAVIAVLYIEIRVRKEGLAESLCAAAAKGVPAPRPTIRSEAPPGPGVPPTS